MLLPLLLDRVAVSRSASANQWLGGALSFLLRHERRSNDQESKRSTMLAFFEGRRRSCKANRCSCKPNRQLQCANKMPLGKNLARLAAQGMRLNLPNSSKSPSLVHGSSFFGVRTTNS